eukprot:1020651-Pelagomonas_calceolata.AAC.2
MIWTKPNCASNRLDGQNFERRRGCTGLIVQAATGLASKKCHLTHQGARASPRGSQAQPDLSLGQCSENNHTEHPNGDYPLRECPHVGYPHEEYLQEGAGGDLEDARTCIHLKY